jgi:DNA transformation protein
VRPDEGFLEWLRELLEPIGRVGLRRMFGGHGLYLDGLFIAIVVDGRLYLKVDAETEAAFRAAGCAPFEYESNGKAVAMSYWSVPESALDSAEDMQPWARRAMAAALRKPQASKAAKAVKAPKKPKPKSLKPAPKRARSAPSASISSSARPR